MMRVSLKWRVLLTIAIIQMAMIVGSGTVILLNARAAIATEVSAAQQSARALVLSTLASLIRRNDPRSAMLELPDHLVQPRHIRILIYDAEQGLLPPPRMALEEEEEPETSPIWFRRWIAPPIEEIRIPVSYGLNTFGEISIATAPDDETAEVWQDVSSLALLVIAAYLGQLALLAAVISSTLSPLQRLSKTLHALEDGNLKARVGPINGPDLGPIGTRIDALAQALEAGAGDRRALAERITLLRDNERKEIAKDLHDELGPCLFGLHVEADAIRAKAKGDLPRHAENIGRITGQIQDINRRLLHSLRPMAIGQLPLLDVLHDLLDETERNTSRITFIRHMPDDLPETDEAIDLTAYRIIQEGVTNALRHSCTTRIDVHLDVLHGSTPEMSIQIRDHGSGFVKDASEGGGILGMRDRVASLGGTLTIAPAPGGGTILNAALPMGPK